MTYTTAETLTTLVSLFNFEYNFDSFCSVFADFEHVISRWNRLCLILDLSMHFRVRFRSLVATVYNSFQPLPILCHKMLNLRFCTVLGLNIVT